MSDIPKTCKAAALFEYGADLKIIDVEIPELKDKGILVKVEMAGVCGSDLHIQNGKLGIKGKLPFIMGHETIGRIVKLGAGRVRDAADQPLNIGDRIIWGHPFCYDCYDCDILGAPAMCRNIGGELKIGYGQAPVEVLMGGFSEYECVSPITKVVRIPDSLTNEECIGVACAFRSVVSAFEKLQRVGGIGLADAVVIQGAGPVGLYSMVLALESGASQVIVVGAPEERLAIARKWGAHHTINIDEVKDPAERNRMIQELTGGRGPEVVIECSGYAPAFSEGVNMLQKGGRYLVVGQTSAVEIPFTPHAILQKNLTILGSGGAVISHFYKALKFIEAKRRDYDFADIVTTKYKLEDVNLALANMRAGKDIKAAIDFGL